jgi:hypothetical protein
MNVPVAEGSAVRRNTPPDPTLFTGDAALLSKLSQATINPSALKTRIGTTFADVGRHWRLLR